MASAQIINRGIASIQEAVVSAATAFIAAPLAVKVGAVALLALALVALYFACRACCYRPRPQVQQQQPRSEQPVPSAPTTGPSIASAAPVSPLTPATASPAVPAPVAAPMNPSPQVPALRPKPTPPERTVSRVDGRRTILYNRKTLTPHQIQDREMVTSLLVAQQAQANAQPAPSPMPTMSPSAAATPPASPPTAAAQPRQQSPAAAASVASGSSAADDDFGPVQGPIPNGPGMQGLTSEQIQEVIANVIDAISQTNSAAIALQMSRFAELARPIQGLSPIRKLEEFRAVYQKNEKTRKQFDEILGINYKNNAPAPSSWFGSFKQAVGNAANGADRWTKKMALIAEMRTKINAMKNQNPGNFAEMLEAAAVRFEQMTGIPKQDTIRAIYSGDSTQLEAFLVRFLTANAL